MTLLEMLKNDRVQPKRMTKSRLDETYEATKEFLPQIVEAKEYGYTWNAITCMIEKILRKEGRWQHYWNSWNIQNNYYRITKEAK